MEKYLNKLCHVNVEEWKYMFLFPRKMLARPRTQWKYRKVSNIRRALVSNTIVDHSDVVGASPVGAAPTTSSFSS